MSNDEFVGRLFAPSDMQWKAIPDQMSVRGQRPMGAVVLCGEMAQASPLQPLEHRGSSHQVGGLVIGEMPARTADASLEVFGVGALGQHLPIVITFDHDRVE